MKKLRLIKTSVFVRHDQLTQLQETDFIGLQDALKNYFSKRGNGKNCVSILRIFPVLSSENSIDIELTAFNEDKDFLGSTQASDDIKDIILSVLEIEISYITFQQVTNPITIMGDFD